MSEILTKGRVVRGWIGMVPLDMDSFEARRNNLPRPGVVVYQLYGDSPAAQAGMAPGDIILTVNGVEGDKRAGHLTHIANAKPGDKVKITGVRGTQPFARRCR